MSKSVQTKDSGQVKVGGAMVNFGTPRTADAGRVKVGGAMVNF